MSEQGDYDSCPECDGIVFWHDDLGMYTCPNPECDWKDEEDEDEDEE